MSDYDVIIVGGGVNGLTAAAYLARAGLKTLVVEARGECGTHCDTTEPGIPGFLHNLHATWIVAAMSPAMGDLELDKFGLEYRTTDYVFGKTFKDGKNVLMGSDPFDSISSWSKVSQADSKMMTDTISGFLPRFAEITDMVHKFLFCAPSGQIEKEISPIFKEMSGLMGLDLSYQDFWRLNGFELSDMLFESEHIKTMIQTLSWIAGMPPIHRAVGSLGILFSALAGPLLTIHNAKGGSHALPHSLVKAATTYGAKILPCCPIKKIVVENGEAKGVVLADEAIFPNETITAKKIISNLTVVPTFLDFIGEDIIGTEKAMKISKFNYDEQNLFGVYYALDGAPQFASQEHDDGIQRCFMGYFGGENTKELEAFNSALVSGRIHEEVIANWFVPTLADPTQAPDGCHTSFVWFDVPPAPSRWKNGKLDGIKSWNVIKDELADQVTDTYESYAPGFKKMIKDRILYTPLDIQNNNPSAIMGNWIGGSMIPEQFYHNRPVAGVLQGGGSRSFVKNLYLSNSIHFGSVSALGSGYIAACEVAEDMGIREQDWWIDKGCKWHLENMNNIPKNMGVKKK